jgi:GMP synthase-like glutamine amidotransferase
MGGPMSVNDDLPWIAPATELIRDALRKDVPVLGHCLGGQLMSKALGGTVRANPVKEIGWGEVRVADNEVAREWLGQVQSFLSFHWHGETFTIPPGATRVMENAHCPNQAFALGKHFGMQCHVEMTEELICSWLSTGGDEIAGARSSPAVQPPEEITRELAPRLGALNEVASRIYDRWVEGLSKS